MFNGVPSVKLEIELDQIKVMTMQALMNRQREISDIVEHKIEQAILQSNIDEIIGEAVNNSIYELFNDYFKYGKGRTAIKNILLGTLEKVFNSTITTSESKDADLHIETPEEKE